MGNQDPVFLDVKDMEKYTMTCNNNNHKWFTSFNNGNGACGVHRKDVNKDWK